MIDIDIVDDGGAEVREEISALFHIAAAAVIELLSLPSKLHVSMLITDDEGIRSINKAARAADEPTDVLSFPMIDFHSKPADCKRLLKGEVDPETLCVLLGDIVISMDTASSQAAQYGNTLSRELAFLFTHGFLHLLGYDHAGSEDESAMRDIQERALTAIGCGRDA